MSDQTHLLPFCDQLTSRGALCSRPAVVRELPTERKRGDGRLYCAFHANRENVWRRPHERIVR